MMTAARHRLWSLRAVAPYWPALLILAPVNVALIVGAARLPYLPGDVQFARFVQSTVGLPVGLAQWITTTAQAPWCFVLLGLTLFACWVIGGWRAALVSIALFFGLWVFGIWLSPIAAQPRPSPQLIRVVGHPKGYAFPSIFGLIYVATFGYLGVVAAFGSRSALLRGTIVSATALVLIIGAIARIVLGAHWPSDLWNAYLVGLFLFYCFCPLRRHEKRRLISEPLFLFP
jgi:membrane-associated phospholipid phosphatase